ncbi:MAG TPA: hypothetical protein VGR21_04725 [Cryptosporangiaceae bacterium]|nr:hypothetical protein [Cryptosporangiaceae bacterium]
MAGYPAEDAADGDRPSGVVAPRLPSSRKPHRWVVAAAVVLVLLTVTGAVTLPNLFTTDSTLTLPGADTPTLDTTPTPSPSAERPTPVSGVGVAPRTPSASASPRPTPSRRTLVRTPPPKPPAPPPQALSVSATLVDATRGCPPGWSAIIYLQVTGTPTVVHARWWLPDGSVSEQVATNDGGGRYHVSVGGLPYDQHIGYSGRATDARGTVAESGASYVLRRKGNCP